MNLDGTVIRIDPDTGAGAPGNPASSSSDANMRRVVATGLRNPFRMAFRPGTSELWAGDVGWSTWEEINRISNPTDSTIDNFGWPCKENDGPNGYDIGLTLCERILDGIVPTVNPHYAYRHGAGDGQRRRLSHEQRCLHVGRHLLRGREISGGVQRSAVLCRLQPALHLGHVPGSRGRARPVDPDSVPTVERLPRGAGDRSQRRPLLRRTSPPALCVGSATTAGNQPPIAAITATPGQGPLPLSVSFSAAGSSDPEGGALTYAWDLDGDGAFDDANGLTASRRTRPRVQSMCRCSVRARRADRRGHAPRDGRLGVTGADHHHDLPRASNGLSDRTSPSRARPQIPRTARSPPQRCPGMRSCTTAATIDGCHEHPINSFDGVSRGRVRSAATILTRPTWSCGSRPPTARASRRRSAVALDPRVVHVTVGERPVRPFRQAEREDWCDTARDGQAIVGHASRCRHSATQRSARTATPSPDGPTVGPSCTTWSSRHPT